MSNVHYEFREASNVDELRELLKLRWRVYRESRMDLFSTTDPSGFDINYYDLHARHFGLFEVCDGTVTPIGYHRPVGEFESPMKHAILQIVAENPHFREAMSPVSDAPLPVMSYSPDAQALRNHYFMLKGRGELTIEPTKFSINKSSSSLKLAMHIIEAELAIHAFCLGVRHALMCVFVNHERFYKRYGFVRVPGTGVQPANGVDTVCVITSRDSVPESLRPRLSRMAVAYLETGKVCFNPSEPDNFYAPASNENTKAMSIAA